jgi:hypothetical protein
MTAKPLCARCLRPVDTFLESFDAFLGQVRFTARCHGETESVVFNEAEITGSIALTHAFVSMRRLNT